MNLALSKPFGHNLRTLWVVPRKSSKKLLKERGKSVARVQDTAILAVQLSKKKEKEIQWLDNSRIRGISPRFGPIYLALIRFSFMIPSSIAYTIRK